MRKVRSGGVCVGFSLLVACGGTASTPTSEAVRTQADPATPAAVQAPVAVPAPVAVQAPVAVVEDAKPPAPQGGGRLVAEEPQGTGFYLAAGRFGDLAVADLGSELVVAGAGVMARLGADGALELMPDMQRGLIEGGNAEGLAVQLLAGRWPETVWMSVETHGERASGNPLMYYRKGERWQRKATRVGPLEWFYAAYAPYTDGQVLGLRMMAPGTDLYEKHGGELPASVQKKIDAATLANPPRLDVLAGGVMTPSAMKLAAGTTPIHFTALPTGEVFVLLASTVIDGEGESTTSFSVQRFTPGGDAGVVDSLTKLSDRPLDLYRGRLAARAANEVYLVGAIEGESESAGLVARFDGKSWTAIAAPPGREATWLALGADSTMWVIAGRSRPDADATTALWKRVGEGPWTEAVLPAVRRPERAEPRWVFHVSVDNWDELPADPVEAATPMRVEAGQVHVRGDEVWVLARVPDADGHDYMRQVVLRSKPVTRVLELPDPAYITALARTAAPRPYDRKKGCEFGPAWIPVAKLAARAGDDAAPIAAAFLASLSSEAQDTFTTLREVEVRGGRMLALTFHAAEEHGTEALVAAVQKFRPDEPHTVECWNPRPTRTFLEAEDPTSE